MKKVQFFLLIEVLIFILAVFDVLGSETARGLLLLALLLLIVRHFRQAQGMDSLLACALVLMALVFVTNGYFIFGCLLAVAYVLINSFARFRKRNQYSRIVAEDTVLDGNTHKTKWIGEQDYSESRFGFDDVNVIRLFGNDVLDLDQSIVRGQNNVVLIRKLYGNTKIIVPIDVELSLSASTLYGKVTFLDMGTWDLRNESVAVTSSHYHDSHKRVKMAINTLYGNVEVIRV